MPRSPGVQWLQNPQSQVYGFTTWLQEIIPVRNFAFERLQSFVPSSRDEVCNHPSRLLEMSLTQLRRIYLPWHNAKVESMLVQLRL